MKKRIRIERKRARYNREREAYDATAARKLWIEAMNSATGGHLDLGNGFYIRLENRMVGGK